eukprot:4968523-Prymnesium_polylepis.1
MSTVWQWHRAPRAIIDPPRTTPSRKTKARWRTRCQTASRGGTVIGRAQRQTARAFNIGAQDGARTMTGSAFVGFAACSMEK